MLLTLLIACGDPAEGVWVGNPTGNMDVSVADSPSFANARGSIHFQNLTLEPCADAPYGLEEQLVLIEDGRGAFPGIEFGTYCRMDAQIDLDLWFDGEMPVELVLENIKVALTGEITQGQENLSFLIGRSGWLEVLAEVDLGDAPGLSDAIESAIESGSSVSGEGELSPTASNAQVPSPPGTPPASLPPEPSTIPPSSTSTEPPEPPPMDIPTSGVPCSAGSVVELAALASAERMYWGATNPDGPGWCAGSVTFNSDLQTSPVGYYDYETGTAGTVDANGFATNCDSVHCNDVTYNDGTVIPEYCSVHAICENGMARSVGFTW